MSSIQKISPKIASIAAYTAYPWENALPKLRFLNPAAALGVQVIYGNDYFTGQTNVDIVANVDAVWIQRDFPRYAGEYQRLKEACLKYSRPVIYDIDDLLFDDIAYPSENEAAYYRPAVGQILDAILFANVITTSSQALKSSLEKFSKPVLVIPNAIAEEQWDFPAPTVNKNRPLAVGYVGTRSHLNDLEQLGPVFHKIWERCGEAVSFHLWIESLPAELACLPNVAWQPFSIPEYERYIQWISKIPVDIWIAPLGNTPFNQAKSPIKFLEYSTRAVPGVYSKVLPYLNVVEDGINGFLAGDEAEWVEKISALANNDDLRLSMGLAAQETVRKNGLLRANLGGWNEVFAGLAAGCPALVVPAEGIRHAFDLLNVHYARSTQALATLERDGPAEKWLIADRELIQEQYARLSASFFIRLRNKFRSIQRRYFSLASPQGKLLDWSIKTTIQRLNRPAPVDPAAPAAQTGPAAQKEPAPLKMPDFLCLALYTTDNWDTASARIRLTGPAQFLNSGIKVLDGCQVTSSASLEFYNHAHAVLIQRDFPRHEPLYREVIRWAREHQKKVIYEIDDLLYDLPEGHPEKEYYRASEPLIRQAIANADAVVGSTVPLVEQLRKLNANAWYLPNYLDDNIWPVKARVEKEPDARIVLGYMAGISQSHAPDIANVMQLLLRLLSDYPQRLSLHFWGGVGAGLPANPAIVVHPERFANYKEFAGYFSRQQADIFVAPLLDNVFNRCKSAIKYLEYSSLGVAGVYSQIQPYQNVITQGENGFLAASLPEWEQSIRLLIEDAALRRNMGEAAFRSIKDQYLMSRHAAEWKRLYARLI